VIVIAMAIAVGSLACAVLTVVLAQDQPAAAATAGVIATSGLTSATTIVTRKT
jgi:hypothetical protein